MRLANPLALAAALVLVAAPNARALEHSGSVSGNWTAAASPHLVMADCRVPAGETLTVESGATVLFEVATGLLVDGRLMVDGDELTPVTFRSILPDGRPGDWEGIVLSGAVEHVIRHAIVEDAAIGVEVRTSANATIDATTIALCEREGLVFRAGSGGRVTDSVVAGNGGPGIMIFDSSPFVTRCLLSANEVPLRVEGATFPTLTNLRARFHRRHDGVDVSTARAIAGAGTWTDGGLPWVVDGGTLVLDPGAIVVLRAGVTLKMGDAARISVSGAFGAAGSTSAPCTIASLRDDTVGGDTNRDGAATFPVKGAWNGIDVTDGGLVSLVGTRLRHADDGVRAQPGATVALRRSDIGLCQLRGLAYAAGARGFVADSSIHDNDIGIYVADADGIDIGRMDPGGDLLGGRIAFGCNAWADVENAGGATLPAHGNYWSGSDPAAGAVLGPVDAGSYLFLEPDGPATARILRVARSFDDTAVLLTWNETATCLGYLVEAAPLPEGPFDALGVPIDVESTLVPATLPGARDIAYYRVRPQYGGGGLP